MRPRLLVLLVLLTAVGAEDPRALEEARIAKRRSLRGAFDSSERLVAEKIEKFALEPIRNWDSALASLATEEAARVANPIRYYLLDEDWEVQAFACRLAGLKDLTALLPDLTEAYARARYPIIRRKAVEAAALMARRKKITKTPPLLIEGLKDTEPGVRHHAVEGLEWLANTAALEVAKKDKDHDTRYRALSALARLGVESAQKSLLIEFRSYVGSADLKRRASLEIYDVGERYSQYLNGMALGYWGGVEGIKLLSRAIQRQGDYRNKLFLSIGSAAAIGLARPQDPDARAEQLKVLKTAMGAGDGVVRAMGAFGAGFTGDASMVRPLRALLKDAQMDVRHNATEALGRIPGTSSVGALASVLTSSRDVAVRLAAVRGLARQEGPAAVQALARALRDKRYMVRVAAARMLGRKGTEAAAVWKPLAKAARDRDYGVREAAVVALARSGAKDGLPTLVAALRDRDAGVRIRAMRALARHRHVALLREDKDAAQRAVALLVRATETLQRKAARECLFKIRSPLAVPPLLKELESKTYSRRVAAFSVLRNYNAGRSLDYAPQLQQDARREAVGRWKTWWNEGGPIQPLPPEPTKRSNQDLPSFHRYTRDLRWRGIDLVLAYDSTGSMIPVIRAVKQRLDILI
ncbi:MAG: HEAT repeat domain-containing protein, partial [Planctomycetota bacterium]